MAIAEADLRHHAGLLREYIDALVKGEVDANAHAFHHRERRPLPILEPWLDAPMTPGGPDTDGLFDLWWINGLTKATNATASTPERFLLPGAGTTYVLERALLTWYDRLRADVAGSHDIPPPPAPLYCGLGDAAHTIHTMAAQQSLAGPITPPDFEAGGRWLLANIGDVMLAMLTVNTAAESRGALRTGAVAGFMPSGLIIAGGAVANALREPADREPINFADVDIWLVGCVSDRAAEDLLLAFLLELHTKYTFVRVVVTESAVSITIDSREGGDARRTDSGLKLQIVLRTYYNGAELLLSFDLCGIMVLVNALGVMFIEYRARRTPQLCFRRELGAISRAGRTGFRIARKAGQGDWTAFPLTAEGRAVLEILVRGDALQQPDAITASSGGGTRLRLVARDGAAPGAVLTLAAPLLHFWAGSTTTEWRDMQLAAQIEHSVRQTAVQAVNGQWEGNPEDDAVE
ncbi:hypothetical protein HYH03_019065 [Edaphochlamys debaryana]|uniref:Uncharacterized protein n=1 Tax=Edaphochlamys debaryana TaxID=47281 RepID=A0A835XET4_9CHLO|nr:hypothetical protein HYH03_019065 [Edaphochlamys debaryana]|eukprot:KAG2481980.1 hypothetical protein HYH03_019065 [Edaphochlamys debaryana]